MEERGVEGRAEGMKEGVTKVAQREMEMVFSAFWSPSQSGTHVLGLALELSTGSVARSCRMSAVVRVLEMWAPPVQGGSSEIVGRRRRHRAVTGRKAVGRQEMGGRCTDHELENLVSE